MSSRAFSFSSVGRLHVAPNIPFAGVARELLSVFDAMFTGDLAKKSMSKWKYVCRNRDLLVERERGVGLNGNQFKGVINDLALQSGSRPGTE